MKLLFDQNLSPPKFLFGHPPKVVWIRRGNCSTKEIEAILRTHHSDLQGFEQGEEGAFLTLE